MKSLKIFGLNVHREAPTSDDVQPLRPSTDLSNPPTIQTADQLDDIVAKAKETERKEINDAALVAVFRLIDDWSQGRLSESTNEINASIERTNQIIDDLASKDKGTTQ